MKTKTTLIFPIVLNYKGAIIHTKAAKCAYGNHEIMYKIAVPSALNIVQLCWVTREKEGWELGLDVAIDPVLVTSIIKAIDGSDAAKIIYPVAELKSA